MTKSKFVHEFTKKEITLGEEYIKWELNHYKAPNFVRNIVSEAVEKFKKGKFSYDGASFVEERSTLQECPENLKGTLFESASLPHDMFNSEGKIGFWADSLFLAIMIILQYPRKAIVRRSAYMFFGTWINVLRHKFWLKDYKGDIDVKDYL